MLITIKKSIRKSKVKSLTARGDKAITRAFLFQEIGKDYVAISFSLLYFTDTKIDDDILVRKCGKKYVYLREWTIKLTTILKTLSNLDIIMGLQK